MYIYKCSNLVCFHLLWSSKIHVIESNSCIFTGLKLLIILWVFFRNPFILKCITIIFLKHINIAKFEIHIYIYIWFNKIRITYNCRVIPGKWSHVPCLSLTIYNLRHHLIKLKAHFKEYWHTMFSYCTS